MKKFIITVENGIGFENNFELPFHEDWVYDIESAKRMAESRINPEWKIIKVEERD